MPFNREKFLFFMLAGIFIWQAALFSWGAKECFKAGGLSACPELGRRYENTTNLMVATVLALLGAGAVASATQRRPSSDDPGDASVSDRPPSRPVAPSASRSPVPSRSGAPERDDLRP